MMREERINTVEELIQSLNQLPNPYIYRGHSNARWKLESTLERLIGANWNNGTVEKFEAFSLQNFKSKFHLYDKENESPRSKLAWLSIMQHYGVPTRLLDFTESPYIALYFALEGYDTRCNDDLAVYAVNYTQMIEESLKYIRSRDSAFKHDRNSIIGKQDEIFEDTVDRYSYDICWVTEPHQLNVRLDRQSGSFVISGNKGARIIDVLASDTYASCDFYKFIISGDLYQNIYCLLRKMNINSKSIYGDLQGLARSIKMDMQVYAL
jgi:hypothetical protein